MRLILVEWDDSFGVSASWVDIPEAINERPATCRSVGWLASENDEAIVVIPHIAARDEESGKWRQGCGDMTIPVSAIRRRIDLEDPLEDLDEVQAEE